jgi:hypothetical protein
VLLTLLTATTILNSASADFETTAIFFAVALRGALVDFTVGFLLVLTGPAAVTAGFAAAGVFFTADLDLVFGAASVMESGFDFTARLVATFGAFLVADVDGSFRTDGGAIRFGVDFAFTSALLADEGTEFFSAAFFSLTIGLAFSTANFLIAAMGALLESWFSS